MRKKGYEKKTNSDEKYDLARNIIRDFWYTEKENQTANISLNLIRNEDYKSEIKKANETVIKNANHWFLVHVISPEISENEKRKRTHKTILLVFVILFLIVQFVFLGYLIYWIFSNIIECHKSNIGFSDLTIKTIFMFLSGYITSIVIELIAILKYIVKNVFDTSVAGLANTFKEESKNKEQQE